MSGNHAWHHVFFPFQAHGGNNNSSSRRSRVCKPPLRKLSPDISQQSAISRPCHVVRKDVLRNKTIADTVASMHFPIGPWNNFEGALNELQEYAKDITTPSDVNQFGSFELVMKGL